MKPNCSKFTSEYQTWEQNAIKKLACYIQYLKFDFRKLKRLRFVYECIRKKIMKNV